MYLFLIIMLNFDLKVDTLYVFSQNYKTNAEKLLHLGCLPCVV